MGLILPIIVILLLFGGMGSWSPGGYGYGMGHGGIGIIGVILVVLLVLMLLGRV